MIELKITEDDYNEVILLISNEEDKARQASLTRRVQELSSLLKRLNQARRPEGRKTRLMETDKED